MAEEESLDDFAFAGPITVREIKKILSLKKPREKINKRATISLTHDELPSTVVPFFDEKEEEFVENTSEFIQKLTNVLQLNDCEDNTRHLNGQEEEDNTEELESSLIVISDDEEEKGYVTSSFTFTDNDNKQISNSMSEYQKPQVSDGVDDNCDQNKEFSYCSNEESQGDNQYTWGLADCNHLINSVENETENLVQHEVNKSSSKKEINQHTWGLADCNELINSVENETETLVQHEVNKSSSKKEIKENMFNDTLEEIEMALKYGLDYSVSSNDSSETVETPPSTPIHVIETTPFQRMPKAMPKEFCFKQPRPKITPIKPKPSNYDNVVSPVAVYIKKSCTRPITRNVAVKDTKLVFEHQKSPVTPKHTINSVLPEVVYKPARQVIATTKVTQKMPASIQKHLPPMLHLTKHQGRVGKKKDSNVGDKLLVCDLTINNSSQLDSTVPLEEISIHCSKDLYIP